MPRVSVITPARDAAPFLPETLGSVFAQTYDDWEVVLVDDGSTDGTGEVARRFGERVRVLETPHSLGPAAARNLAVREAGGELLATLDADDLLDREYLAHQVGLYDRESSLGRVGIVACNARLLGPDGFAAETWVDRVGDAHGATLDDLLRENLVFGNAIFPRTAFEEAGGYDTSLRISEDYDLWLRIVERGYRVVATRRPLAVYRMRTDSLMADAELRAGTARRVYELAIERGALTPRQRRLARKNRRLHALLQRRAVIASDRREGRRGMAARLSTLPATALVALEHPERWRAWALGRGPRDLGPARRA
jgi:glycosyltransferase involved in cell wall biosynthesis